VRQELQLVESYLLDSLDDAHVASSARGNEGVTLASCHGDWRAAAHRIHRAANMVPRANQLDLMRMTWDPDLLPRLNPFLSEAARRELVEASSTWMQLCVLEGMVRHS
jgi:hypothetical protein